MTEDSLSNARIRFHSNNTELPGVEEVKAKLLTLQTIRDEISDWNISFFG